MKLKNKTAIVTGASGFGMGRSIALALAKNGANVVVNYNSNSASANDIAAAINLNYSKSIAIKADIFDNEEVNSLIEETMLTFGQIDILTIGPGADWNMESINQLNVAKSLSDLNNEVSPIYNLFPKVLPLMYKQQWGRIIGISLLDNPPTPSYSYNVAKKARTNALLLGSQEAWKNNVTINVISPGPVSKTNSLEEAIDLNKNKGTWHERSNITPQDIAEMIVYLCSDCGDYITGTEIKFNFK